MASTVSVVVIFLNEERYLLEAVASVRAQTFADWELLLCDDGSTDDSTRMARELAAQDSRIRWLEHPGHENRGMSATRNLGLWACRGRYVALLDADDVWLPRKLEQQVAIMDRYPTTGMVCGAAVYWRSWSGAPEASDRSVPVGGPQDVLTPPPQLLTDLYPLGSGQAPCPSGVLLRRSDILAVGGFGEHFTGERQLYEDQGFLTKLYLTTDVYVSSSCVLRYRERPDSCVATVTSAGRYQAVRRYFLAWLGSVLAREGVTDQRVWSAWRAASRQQRPAARARRAVRRAVGRRLPAPVRRRLRATARMVRRGV